MSARRLTLALLVATALAGCAYDGGYGHQSNYRNGSYYGSQYPQGNDYYNRNGYFYGPQYPRGNDYNYNYDYYRRAR